MPSVAPPALTPLHHRRLRDVWRSAGWPCCDGVEVELLAAGLVQRMCDGAGRETLRVTDAGIAVLARTLASNRRARDEHETLVGRVAAMMQREGRIVWRGLALRARVDGDWGVAMPDVFSIRHTSREDAVEPVVHEIKVRRADLLADLRRPAKGAAYRELSSQCWYVLRAGIGGPNDVPDPFGVMLAHDDGIEVARPARPRDARITFHLWMALARATPEPVEEPAQRLLGDPGVDGAQSFPPPT